MRLRLCCCYNCGEEDNRSTFDVRRSNLPPVITQPSKTGEPVQLDRITEVSAEESSVQEARRQALPVRGDGTRTHTQQATTEATQSTKLPQSTDLQTTEPKSTEPHLPPDDKLQVTFKHVNCKTDASTPTPQTTITASDGTVTFYRIEAGHFKVTHNSVRSNCGFLEVVSESHSTAAALPALSQDEARALAAVPSFRRPELTLADELTLSIRCAENLQIALTAVEPGNFRCKYNGIEFTVSNGQVSTDCTVTDFESTVMMLAHPVVKVGLKLGVLGLEVAASALQSTSLLQPEDHALIKRFSEWMDVLYPSEGTQEHPTQSVLATQYDLSKDTVESERTPEPERPRPERDEVDGEIPVPVLRKTTFTPQAIIYDDPKTYEELDKNEIPAAQRLDEFIISKDETAPARNRYYFHEARPRRAKRRPLTKQEKLRLSSPERYFHFERECLREHNRLRKNHGVPPLVHNEFLSQVAREWAEHLALKDTIYHRPKNDYGENIFTSTGMDTCAQTAVMAWYEEIDLYDYNDPKFEKATGHFTQLIWRDTREVGTGLAQIGNKVWVCCNYHPPGNVMGEFNDVYVPRPLVERC